MAGLARGLFASELHPITVGRLDYWIPHLGCRPSSLLLPTPSSGLRRVRARERGDAGPPKQSAPNHTAQGFRIRIFGQEANHASASTTAPPPAQCQPPLRGKIGIMVPIPYLQDPGGSGPRGRVLISTARILERHRAITSHPIAAASALKSSLSVGCGKRGRAPEIQSPKRRSLSLSRSSRPVARPA